MSNIPANMLARRRIAQNTEEGQLTLDNFGARITRDNTVSVIDVIVDVKKVDHNYAGQIYSRLLAEGNVPNCELRPLASRSTPANCRLTPGKRGACREHYDTPVASLQ